MTKIEIHSFDEILDAKYGKDGTVSREQFEREAEAYCVGQIISDGRKREKMKPVKSSVCATTERKE